MNDDELTAAYVESVGKPPGRFPDDHPGAWEWSFRGTRAEVEEMKQRFGLVESPSDQPSLFTDA